MKISIFSSFFFYWSICNKQSCNRTNAYAVWLGPSLFQSLQYDCLFIDHMPVKTLVKNGHRTRIGVLAGETFIEKIFFNFKFTAIILGSDKSLVIILAIFYYNIYIYIWHRICICTMYKYNMAWIFKAEYLTSIIN